MKLIRFTLPNDYTTRLADCLTQNDIDFLQLDFSRCSEQTKPTSSIFAGDFRSYWRDIHKALYLSPTLQVVTNAGEERLIAFMEELAGFLGEHGSADLPIACVRGGNLMNSLEEVIPREIFNKDQKLLAAQVEIGGGPIATALAEGARIVVCSEYDTTAPFLAAGVHNGFCSWDDISQLGHLAAASQFLESLVTISDGTVNLEYAANDQLSAVQKLGRVQHADVVCDYTHLELSGRLGGLALANIDVESPVRSWKLRLTFERGYQLVGLISTAVDRHAQLSRFFEQELPPEKFRLKAYVAADVSESAEYLEKLSFQGTTRPECQQVLSAVESFLREKEWGTIAEPRPTLEIIQKTEWHTISRDELALAVETRPAHEWL